MKNHNIIIREASEKDILGIIQLHHSQSGLLIGKHIWEWQYFKRTGYDTIFVVAEKDGEIIGTQAIIPIKIISNSGIFLTGKSESTLVHKLFRGHGVFNRMYEKIFEIANQKGIEAIWGFTGAEKAFSRVGFNIPTKLSIIHIWLDVKKAFAFYLEKLKKYHGFLSYLTALPLLILLIFLRIWLSICLHFFSIKYRNDLKKVNLIMNNRKDFENFLMLLNKRNQENGIVTIYRDLEYMNWRIFNNPSINYNVLLYSKSQIKGYLIFYIYKEILFITDYYCSNSDRVFSILLAKTIIYGLKNKCNLIQLWDSESSENQKYSRILKIFSSLKFKHINPMVFKIIRNEMTNDKQNVSHWFITEIFSQGIL